MLKSLTTPSEHTGKMKVLREGERWRFGFLGPPGHQSKSQGRRRSTGATMARTSAALKPQTLLREAEGQPGGETSGAAQGTHVHILPPFFFSGPQIPKSGRSRRREQEHGQNVTELAPGGPAEETCLLSSTELSRKWIPSPWSHFIPAPKITAAQPRPRQREGRARVLGSNAWGQRLMYEEHGFSVQTWDLTHR